MQAHTQPLSLKGVLSSNLIEILVDIQHEHAIPADTMARASSAHLFRDQTPAYRCANVCRSFILGLLINAVFMLLNRMSSGANACSVVLRCVASSYHCSSTATVSKQPYESSELGTDVGLAKAGALGRPSNIRMTCSPHFQQPAHFPPQLH